MSTGETEPAPLMIEVTALPEGHVLLEAVCVIKALDNEGEECLLYRRSHTLNHWEAIGMLVTIQARMLEIFNKGWEEEDSD